MDATPTNGRVEGTTAGPALPPQLPEPPEHMPVPEPVSNAQLRALAAAGYCLEGSVRGVALFAIERGYRPALVEPKPAVPDGAVAGEGSPVNVQRLGPRGHAP